jgi:hypothetical protein
MAFKPADDIVDEPVSWLWPNYIPADKIGILDGDPDLGKSLIALDLCARLSTGAPFPDGQPGPGPSNALVLTVEDTVTHTVVPRLRRAGADMKRVFVWQHTNESEHWPWHFPTDIERLDDALARTDARLAVIDPVMAFLDDKVNSGSDQSVRRALVPLIQVAESRRCAVLMHRHLNKQGSGKALYRGLGSIAFVAACRFAMLVGHDPRDHSQFVLAQVRNTLAALQPSLAYRIIGTDKTTASVQWLGPNPHSANELLAGKSRQQNNPRDQAAAFLEQFLAAGPRTSQEIWEAAVKAGLSKRTLERAKRGMEIRCRRVQVDGWPVSYWLLRDQELPAQFAAEIEFDRYIRELEKRYPRNPLDEEVIEDGREWDE